MLIILTHFSVNYYNHIFHNYLWFIRPLHFCINQMLILLSFILTNINQYSCPTDGCCFFHTSHSLLHGFLHLFIPPSYPLLSTSSNIYLTHELLYFSQGIVYLLSGPFYFWNFSLHSVDDHFSCFENSNFFWQNKEIVDFLG